MSYEYRVSRFDEMEKNWPLERLHDLMARYNCEEDEFANFKLSIKLYISRALKINFTDDDEEFINLVDKARDNRLNITPNGAVVPKREYQLEYNIILRQWCELIRKITKKKPELLKRFRATPNIRIKFGQELEDNLGRGLSTSLPHSDGWVEGPWGMNCYFPILGDVENNNLLFYKPKKFEERFISTSDTYENMQWVMEYYEKDESLSPKKGAICLSDYALIHNTFRKKKAGTRISIDTTFFIGDHLPHEDRIIEYRDKIPNIGLDEFIDAGRYENEKLIDNKSAFTHYTTGKIKSVFLDSQKNN